MKKTNLTALIAAFLVSVSLPVFSAADYTASSTDSTQSDDTLNEYIKSLGNYLGYDLTKEPSAVPTNAPMFDFTTYLASTGQDILNVFFAALPFEDPSLKPAPSFVQDGQYKIYNDNINHAFTNMAFTVQNFDQKPDNNTTVKDPVSQALLNLVSTPDPSECTVTGSDTNKSIICSNGTILSQNDVMATVLKDVSKDGSFAGLYGSSSDTTQQPYYKNAMSYLSQVNVNNLLSPLIYDASASKGNTSTLDGSKGLPHDDQVQQAFNFIRYVTGAVLPVNTMQGKDYSALVTTVYDCAQSGADKTTDDCVSANKNLSQYLLGLRIYAAQNSVAVSNIYGILAKRMPQDVSIPGANGSETKTSTSQAFNEFQSATWRIYNPNSDVQWSTQISNASPAAVQKEIAMMLSEMNYQLYLNRQQEERMLLTNSLLLIQAIQSGLVGNPIIVPPTSEEPASTS